MNKPELRRAIRSRLLAIDPQTRAARSRAICRQVASSAPWEAARVVGFFAPLASEPDVSLLWERLGPRLACYPRVEGERLHFYEVGSPEALEPSRWSLLEPPAQEERRVPPWRIDLLLVPGMAFSPTGGRMGRGKGFYDRLLSSPAGPAIAAGVCFAEQVVPRLPQEAHDRPVARLFFA